MENLQHYEHVFDESFESQLPEKMKIRSEMGYELVTVFPSPAKHARHESGGDLAFFLFWKRPAH